MTVSFIVPVYNGCTLTQAMLASLRATIPPGLAHEIILVDDGSTDGTRDWLRTLSDPPFRVILNERRLGYAANNNLAAELASGDFLVLLNNDIALVPGWFDPMLTLAQHPNSGIVGNVQLSVRTRQVHHAGVFFSPSGTPYHFQPSLDFLRAHPVLHVPAVTGAVVAVRRTLFREMGGLDEGYFNSHEDIDFCLRVRSAGKRISVAANSAAYHYICSSPGRHEAEDRNSARFDARWGAVARDLAASEPAPIELPPASNGQGLPLPFERETYATLQAFHPASGGHAEDYSSVHVYRTGRWARVHLPLVKGLVDGGFALRLDPCDFAARIRISSVALSCEGSRHLLWRVNGAAGLRELFVVAGTAASVPESDRWFSVECTGRDPQLIFRSGSVPEEFKNRVDMKADIWIHTTASG